MLLDSLWLNTVSNSLLGFLIEQNFDLLVYIGLENGRIQEWWDDWGKCAAGIVGGGLGKLKLWILGN